MPLNLANSYTPVNFKYIILVSPITHLFKEHTEEHTDYLSKLADEFVFVTIVNVVVRLGGPW